MLRIGTSGWNYKHWKEVFYPGDVRPAEWLAFYASHFSTVEINNVFYRKPTRATVEAWEAATPEGFTFAVKMWRGITHYRLLLNCADLLARFMPLIQVLPGAKRGPLLVQLPERMKPGPERLEKFLEDLRESFDEEGWRVAVEFRSTAWVTAEIVEILTRHEAALVVHDMHYCTITEPNEVPWVYMRRHGGADPGHAGNYTHEQIAADAGRVGRWLAEGRDVYVYYNNDWRGYALHNARELGEMLAGVAP